MKTLGLIQNLFTNIELVDKNDAIAEISAMRNSQPPKRPSFIVNQEDAKKHIVTEMANCAQNNMFSYIVLSGDVGDGKTLFLNWIYRYFSEHKEFHMIKFRVEESSTVKYSFIKMLVAEVFKRYNNTFNEALKNAFKIIDDNLPEDEYIGKIIEEYHVSNELARTVYEFHRNGKATMPAFRVLGACYGKTELAKLKINNLKDTDYHKVFEWFQEYRITKGLIIILLDEFEHTYLSLTPAMRKSFMLSYKNFIDRTAADASRKTVLIAASTEQYQGQLEKGVSDIDRALWSRLNGHIVYLAQFRPADDKNVSQLFDELRKRYEKAYDINLPDVNPSTIRKHLHFKLGGDTTLECSYRIAVSSLLVILEELRSAPSSTLDSQDDKHMKEENHEHYKIIQQQYQKLIEETIKDWDDTHYNNRPGKIKSILELLFNEHKYTVKPVPGLNKQRVDALFVEPKVNGKPNKFIFIAIATTAKSLTSKLIRCNNIRDELVKAVPEIDFQTYFIYQANLANKGFKLELNKNTHIFPIEFESEFYDLLALNTVKDENVKQILLSNLKDTLAKLDISI